jgi:hypothetical protein
MWKYQRGMVWKGENPFHPNNKYNTKTISLQNKFKLYTIKLNRLYERKNISFYILFNLLLIHKDGGMQMDKAFIDVNREQYMNALFLDLQKSTKMVDLPNKADLIYDFVSNMQANQNH